MGCHENTRCGVDVILGAQLPCCVWGMPLCCEGPATLFIAPAVSGRGCMGTPGIVDEAIALPLPLGLHLVIFL